MTDTTKTPRTIDGIIDGTFENYETAWRFAETMEKEFNEVRAELEKLKTPRANPTPTPVPDCYPRPWMFDFFEHPVPRYRSATIYAADSTWVAKTTGVHCEQLAQSIIDAVNKPH